MIQIVTTLLAAFLAVSPRILIPAPAEIISGQEICVLPEKLSYNIVCKQIRLAWHRWKDISEHPDLHPGA